MFALGPLREQHAIRRVGEHARDHVHRAPPPRVRGPVRQTGVVNRRAQAFSGCSAPWQCLYLRPDPQGQGSLRPTLATSRTNGCGGRARRARRKDLGILAGFPHRLGGLERRNRLGVLQLQRAREPPLPLQFLLFDLGLAAYLDLRNRRDGVVLDAVEHRGEQFERLALVFLLRILLRVAAQVNPLAHVVHGREMLAPMLIERLQHHLLLDVAHDLGPDARALDGIGVRERGEHLLA